MNPTIVTATLLIVAGLAGCASPEALTPSEERQNSSNREETRQDVPGGVILQYTGNLEADACMVSQQANTCQPHTREAETPPPHVSWHEIKVESASELSIESDWTWQESGHATFYAWLICQDRNHNPCMTSDGNVAYKSGDEPVISILDLDFQSFNPGHHRLWVYFGVEPEPNASGEHYPRVNVDYTLTVRLEDAA